MSVVYDIEVTVTTLDVSDASMPELRRIEKLQSDDTMSEPENTTMVVVAPT